MKAELLTREEWLARREKYVTATSIAGVCGVDPYMSPSQVLKDKKVPPTFAGNGYTLIGKWLEPVVISATNHVMQTSFRSCSTEDKLLLCYEDHLGMACSPDAQEGNILLECKTVQPKNYIKYMLEPPLKYVMQLHMQMFLLQATYGYLSILSTNMSQDSPHLNLQMSVFKVVPNLEIYDIMKDRVKSFWLAYQNNTELIVPTNLRKYLKMLLTYEKVR